MSTRDRVYDYIAGYIHIHGIAPSIRQIMRSALGSKSTSHVVYHLERLEAAGRIVVVRNEANEMLPRGILLPDSPNGQLRIMRSALEEIRRRGGGWAAGVAGEALEKVSV